MEGNEQYNEDTHDVSLCTHKSLGDALRYFSRTETLCPHEFPGALSKATWEKVSCSLLHCGQRSLLSEYFPLVSKYTINPLILQSKQIYIKPQGSPDFLCQPNKSITFCLLSSSPNFFTLCPATLCKVIKNLGIWSAFSDTWPTGTWHGLYIPSV